MGIIHAMVVPNIMDITNNWYNYLNTERKLSHEVIKMAGLDVHNGLLKIPVFDIDGKLIFSKFRRSPWGDQSIAKYQYEVGSKTSLYGIDHLGDKMVICEGELDALALLTCGYNACSSTGGSLSFQEEWAPHFDNRKVTIMFDNDDAGVKGALKTAKIIKKFTYRWVPPRFGKDIGDVLTNHGCDKVNEIMEGTQNCIEMEIPDLSTKRARRDYMRVLKITLRGLTHGSVGSQFIRAFLVDIKTSLVEQKPKKNYNPDMTSPELERAKAYPIEKLIKVTRRQAICPFHTEKTGSLHVYPDNHAFCFGSCQKPYDAINIAMQVWGVDFKEALKRLS